MPLKPRHINFLAALEAVHGQPDYASRPTLLNFVASHKGAKGPLGYPIRWPAWLTYNQDPAKPYKSLRRGHFRLTEAWAEYNSLKVQGNPALLHEHSSPLGSEEMSQSPTP
jgi:hypothetical protein